MRAVARITALGFLWLPTSIWAATNDYQLLYSLTHNHEFGLTLAGTGDNVYIGNYRLATGRPNSGIVYQYSLTSGDLVRGIVDPTFPSDFAEFGTTVVAHDNAVLISAPRRLGGSGPGNAFLFDATSGSHLQMYSKPNPNNNDLFGASLGITATKAIIGAPGADAAGADAGAAYVFDYTGSLLHTLTSPTPAPALPKSLGGGFGVSMATTGNIVAVGEQLVEVSPTALNTGEVHLFDVTTGSVIRSIASPNPGTRGDRFGASIVTTGNNLFVSAPDAFDPVTGIQTGLVYSYDIQTGQLLNTIRSPTPEERTAFGSLVAAADGNLFVGYTSHTSPTGPRGSGAVYVFNATTGDLQQTISNPNPEFRDEGFGVVVGAFENTLLVTKTDGNRGVNTNGPWTVYAYSNDPRIPPPAERLQSHLPPLTDAKNLVLVTHGWDPPFVNSDFGWVNLMVDAIRSQLDDQWQVISYDWSDASATLDPNSALLHGDQLGRLEGMILAQTNDYHHVHLIAHSAGSALIDSIASQFRMTDPHTTIHTTFLDAFAPPWNNEYGLQSTWSDHYFNTTDPLAFFTETTLAHAHNVDVTAISPLPLDAFTGHGWPHQFYRETILGLNANAGVYGYPLSFENNASQSSTTWILSRLDYPLGQLVALGTSRGTPDQSRFSIDWREASIFGSPDVQISPTGNVTLTSDSLLLETGSPAWATIPFQIVEGDDLFRFGVDFLSDPGAEGLLAVYLDNELLATVDERLAPSDAEEFIIDISLYDPGVYSLAFRLDPFTTVQSRALITSPQFGTITVVQAVPEPSSLVLFALVAILLAGVLRLDLNVRNQRTGRPNNWHAENCE